MAFTPSSLSVLAYAQGFTLWHYRGADDCIGELASPMFFGEAGDLLATGDMLLISARDGGKVLCVTNAEACGKTRTAPLC